MAVAAPCSVVAAGMTRNMNERIENIETEDLVLSQEIQDNLNENQKNSRNAQLKKAITGGLHKLNKVISGYFSDYGQPYYDQ